jgi:PAS domain S-box-containing protein
MGKDKRSRILPGIEGLEAAGVCPVTKRTTWTRADWNVELPHYTNRLLLLDERTILAESRGFINDADSQEYCHRFDRLLAAVAPGEEKVHLLEDWSQLRGADTGARRTYVAYHMRHRHRLASVNYFGLNGLTRLLVVLGKALHVVPFPVDVHEDYGATLIALGLATPSAVARVRRDRPLLPVRWMPSFLLRGHAKRLADIFGSLPWESAGEGRNPLPRNDPFHDLVAGWIAVKADLDHLNERARRQEANFRALMESAREGVWLSDGRGESLWANGSMAQLLGTSVIELSGRKLSEILPAGILLEARHSTTDPIELRLPRPDGEEVWAMVSAGPIPAEDNGEPGIYAICTNISGRRKAEARVRDLAEDLERRVVERTEELASSNLRLGSALRSREEFLAAMSHELRTPLATILNISESLRGGVQGELDERQAERLRLLENNGHHLLALINDVLDLSKSLAGKLELTLSLVDLGQLCRESAESLRPLAEAHGVDLACEPPPSRVHVRADPLRLRQILTNLLSNACKFAGRGALAGVRVVPDPDGGLVRIEVWDEGPGISREAQEKLFQPFVQLDNRLSRAHGGTGLGLALSRQLAEQHGGRILLDSTPGHGSVFAIELPWQDTGDEPPTETGLLAASGSVARSAVRERKILLVEDNADLRQTMHEYLVAAGWEVRIAAGGQAALELHQEEVSDIILMDIQMPGMDGLEAIRRLREAPGGAFPKVVAISGLAFPEDVMRSKQAGADLHLAKPVRLRQLSMLLESLLEE